MSVSEPNPPAAEPVRKGLEGVVAGETSISDVDGQNCQLIYRGYSIEELAGKASYEEVSFLLFFDHLPSRSELADWIKQLESLRTLDPGLLEILKCLPQKSNAMAWLRSAISILGQLDSEEDEEALEVIQRKAIRTVAMLPCIAAAIGRLRAGKLVIEAKKGLSHAANFLYMLHGSEPTTEQATALDAYFVLLADHGFNASTFTARTILGTKSDYYSAIVGAIGSLKGPLHGAANRKAMEMLLEIGSPEQVVPYVQRTLEDHKRFMGFGHRVYKGEDPRAKQLKGVAKQLGETSGDPRWFEISENLQKAVWEAKKLYINVDFYSASLLHYVGIPTELFTTMFACARVAGWSAHVMEQARDNRLIRPLALYVGKRDLKFVALNQRS